MRGFMGLARTARTATAFLLGAAIFGVAVEAAAEVSRQGEWPDLDKRVTLDVAGVSRSVAVKKLAEAAGWSVMLSFPAGEPIDLNVSDQPAGKVLDLILSDADYVASRDGALIEIRRAAAASPGASPPDPAVAPAPPPAPAPTERGSDRLVSGHSLRIEAGETVHDVAVIGGSVEVFGTVTGDLVVSGGSLHIYEGAHVFGDASTVGGSVTVDDGARVDGDIDVVGGSLRRGAKAIIGGGVEQNGDSGRRGSGSGGDDGSERGASALASFGRDVARASTRSALLFVFGAVLLSLWPRRMEVLKVEVASRPMRTFAMGVVGILGVLALSAVLCVTVLGIPFAIVGLLLAMFAICAGLCATLETAGAAIAGHRAKSPYTHLAAGCLLLLVLSPIPFVGGLITFIAVMIGAGSIIATRVTGLFPSRPSAPPPAPAPYR